ncbi:hypothetical protein SCUCBS95973_003044 [Sporothrix curviconia]|uniref:CENP-V/GFA domain-containing protein n=1 Tax=Sporothrix curviconia TaxID=1260050 RepID=A0ABP0BC56_9PEZI
MSTRRTLRGGCQCGRNMYIIQPPPDASEVARLLFDTAPSHRASLASPLPTYLRVPLAWYHSTTMPLFPDETQSMIHRSYEHLNPGAARGGGVINTTGTRRHFCGFCGTPLSFWSETPKSEADYIRLALGSLSPEDLDELDEWTGAADESDEGEEEKEEEEEEEEEEGDNNKKETVVAESLKRARPGDGPVARVTSSTGIPWFDSFIEGSRLYRHLQRQQKQNLKQAGGGTHIRRHDAGSAQSADGTVHFEWEVLEWAEGDDGDDSDIGLGKRSSEQSPAKRARLGEDDSEGGANVAAGMDVE